MSSPDPRESVSGARGSDVIRASCPARAALAGNPSDGYGGAVFAVPVPTWRATVDVSAGVASGRGPGDAVALVEAAHRSWQRFVGSRSGIRRLAPLDRLGIGVTTSIPRAVGLAGSSAIIIAALRAFAASTDTTLGTDRRHRVRLDELATMAWWAENDYLNIACGLQDRVVQAYARPMLMDFAPEGRPTVLGYPAGRYRPVDDPAVGDHPPRGVPGGSIGRKLFVASQRGAAESSGILHDRLRRTGAAAEHADVMRRLGATAHDAAAAFARRDHAALAGAMRSSFRLRRTALGVDAVTAELVDRAGAFGAAANTTGSGGSIVVLAPDATTRAATWAALVEIGCACVDVDATAGEPAPR